jgi:predicted GNAT family acetyltransferase
MSSGEQALAVHDNPGTHRLEAAVGALTSYAEYQLAPGTITFTHTRVPEELRGRGIGTRLIEAGLAMARERGLKVIPQCPFFASYMRAHAQTQELLAPAGRALLHG